VVILLQVGFSYFTCMVHTTLDPLVIFRSQAAHIVSLITKDPKELEAPTVCPSIRENDLPILYLLAKTNTFVSGALRHCLSHCVASVHELLMTLM
jgi:hypothetical protein